MAGSSDDKDRLEERKKKFGNNEGGISLDDEINKSKTIKKDFKKHKFQQHRHHNHHKQHWKGGRR